MRRYDVAKNFLKNLSPESKVDASVLRALRLYFSNQRHALREPINRDHIRLVEAGPLRLEEYFEGECLTNLEKRCFKLTVDGQTNPDDWRDTKFTRFFGQCERKIMSDIAHRELFLIEFCDEQTADSWSWEQFNRGRHEYRDMVPVYRMSAGKASFDFILRPWQRGGDPITIVG